MKELNVAELSICGLATEGCIDSTIRSAYSRGYTVTLASDAHTTTKNAVLSAEQIVAHHNLVLARFARVQQHGEIGFA